MLYSVYAYLRVAVALASLGYASIHDVREREVPDRVWLLSFPTCLVLAFIDAYFGLVEWGGMIVSLFSALLLGLLLFHLGFYGGADVKALLLMAAAIPSYRLGHESIFNTLFPSSFLMAFFFSTILSVLFPLYVLILNLLSIFRGEDPLRGIQVTDPLRRILLLITARRVSLEELRRGGLKYMVAEEPIEGDGGLLRKPIYCIRIREEDEDMIKKIEEHRSMYKDGVLVSPTIPMIIFLTLGFLLTSILLLLYPKIP